MKTKNTLLLVLFATTLMNCKKPKDPKPVPTTPAPTTATVQLYKASTFPAAAVKIYISSSSGGSYVFYNLITANPTPDAGDACTVTTAGQSLTLPPNHYQLTLQDYSGNPVGTGGTIYVDASLNVATLGSLTINSSCSSKITWH